MTDETRGSSTPHTHEGDPSATSDEDTDPEGAEQRIRLGIMKRMGDLHARLGHMLTDWITMVSSDEGARGARLVAAALNDVTAALDQAYRARLRGALHPLESQFWIPALETVRQDLRRAAASLNSMRGPRLERAVENLRRSMSAVQAPPTRG